MIRGLSRWERKKGRPAAAAIVVRVFVEEDGGHVLHTLLLAEEHCAAARLHGLRCSHHRRRSRCLTCTLGRGWLLSGAGGPLLLSRSPLALPPLPLL
jgi:hypothetical protein